MFFDQAVRCDEHVAPVRRPECVPGTTSRDRSRSCIAEPMARARAGMPRLSIEMCTALRYARERGSPTRSNMAVIGARSGSSWESSLIGCRVRSGSSRSLSSVRARRTVWPLRRSCRIASARSRGLTSLPQDRIRANRASRNQVQPPVSSVTPDRTWPWSRALVASECWAGSKPETCGSTASNAVRSGCLIASWCHEVQPCPCRS